jgi:uncharacterized protein (DUF433 family)
MMKFYHCSPHVISVHTDEHGTTVMQIQSTILNDLSLDEIMEKYGLSEEKLKEVLRVHQQNE